VVISLQSSDTANLPPRQSDARSRRHPRSGVAGAARNVIGRVESSWAPASTEEGFEIVRAAFEPLSSANTLPAATNVARAFADLYLTQIRNFRRRAEIPIRSSGWGRLYDPSEVFDRLYTDW